MKPKRNSPEFTTAVLTLPNGRDEPGILRFPEYPKVKIDLGLAHANILLALHHQYHEQHPVHDEDRGWSNSKGLSRAHRAAIGRTISADTCTKYVRTLIYLIEASFEARGRTPALIKKKRGRGSRLALKLTVDDLTLAKEPRRNYHREGATEA